MEINKRNIIIGAVSLIVTAILHAIIVYTYKRDWITLLFVIVYACLFLKYWHDEGFKQRIKNKIGKERLKGIGFVIMLVGLSLLPQSFGLYLGDVAEFIGYIFSFIGCTLGLIFIQIASEKE